MIELFSMSDLKSHLTFKNPIRLEHFRDDQLLKVYESFNDVVNVGKNKLLDVFFNSVSPLTTWYIGLISNASFSALAPTDTMSSHAGWLEFTGYSQVTRPSWGQGASSGQSVTNATAVTFTINISSGNVFGLFVTSDNTISGTAGTLWATAGFAAVVPVVNGDQLKVTYTISC